MSTEARTAPPTAERVEECWEVSPGMRIEVRERGVRHFAGEVTEVHSGMGLFWAVSEVGERRIVELDEYEVYRLE